VIFCVICSPLMMAGYIMFLATIEAKVRYGALFLIASGSFVFGPLCNANISANVVSDTARSAAIGTAVMFNTIGGLISTWSFLPLDAPAYHIGNGVNLAAASTTFVIGVSLYFWMKWDNRRRRERNAETELQGLSLLEIQDLDWVHPDFRWRL
jgi:sugar phosphate permease